MNAVAIKWTTRHGQVESRVHAIAPLGGTLCGRTVYRPLTGQFHDILRAGWSLVGIYDNPPEVTCGQCLRRLDTRKGGRQ